MVGMGIKPAKDEHCNVNYVAMQALAAMEKAFKDLSAHIEMMFGYNGVKAGSTKGKKR
ncbi:hypothetical protein PBI_ANDPEGGY_60 [Gordonia phage AndPeggy]|nr:hypothetical protein PBI_ANDPEGGY_60 [Gordonia phage AndPeggy]